MIKSVKAAAIAIAVTTGAAVLSTSSAQAGQFSFGFEIRGPGGYYHFHNGHPSQGHYHNGPRHHNNQYRAQRGCKPRLAVRKARKLGVHRAQLIRMNKKTLKVRGFRYGHRTVIKFANRRGCPIIAR